MREWLAIPTVPGEARVAHVAPAFRLTEIYVPFVKKTDARCLCHSQSHITGGIM